MAANQRKAAPEPNSKGLVVLKHKETGAVQEFVAESVETWMNSGWEPASDKDVETAAEEGRVTTAALPDEEKK